MDKISSRAVVGMIYEALEQGAAGWVNQLSMHMDSDQASEEYAWLGQVPAMREMIGGRKAKGLSENDMKIVNKEFEATLKVKVKDLRRDKTGQLNMRIGELADRANLHWARLLSVLIKNGASQICYDGHYFFDTTHQEGDSGVHSNKIEIDISELPVGSHGSPLAPSVSEMQAAIMKTIEQIYSFKDNEGEPLNENAKKFLVMVPLNLWTPGAAAASNPVIDGGDTNTLVRMDGFDVDIVTNARLEKSGTFSVFRADGRSKPFIRQEEVPVEVSAIAEGSETEFRHKEHHYGLYAAGNVGYGMWQHACQGKMV